MLRDARAVFFTSNEEQLLVRESFWLYRCNEVVVNFGIAGFTGDPTSQLEVFYAEFPSLRKKRILLFLSRIHLKKGCDLLIKAFAKICQRDESLHLVFVGPDQDGWKVKLEQLSASLCITDRITWAGMVIEDTKWGAFHAAEAFVLPSHSENFGAVVAEALSCGLPVLISNKVNIWREIINYKAGLVEDDDLAGTIRLLERWLQFSPVIKIDMRLQSKRCFYEKFEITMAVENLISAINHSIGRDHD